MYGLVNQGVHDLALELGGERLWQEIKEAAGIDEDAFIAMGTYSDDVTYRLVESASSVLGLSSTEVLEAFGRHWILYTAREGYGRFFDTMGRSLPEFLANLDAMHARLSLSMPELQPPSFVCEQLNESQIRLEYWSHRAGLAPMVVGLLVGLGELFGLSVSVSQSISRSAGADHDEFVVEFADAAAAESLRHGTDDLLQGVGAPAGTTNA